MDLVAKQVDMYNWLANNSNSTNGYAGKPWAWPEWGVGINGWFPTAADQTNSFKAMTAALNARVFPRVRYLAYFDDDVAPNASSAILPGSWGSNSNLANSPYVTRQLAP